LLELGGDGFGAGAWGDVDEGFGGGAVGDIDEEANGAGGEQKEDDEGNEELQVLVSVELRRWGYFTGVLPDGPAARGEVTS
jgi:hypothetical protein